MDSEYFSIYSITGCRIDCETRYLLENCNCRMVHMPGVETTRYIYRQTTTLLLQHVHANPQYSIHCTNTAWTFYFSVHINYFTFLNVQNSPHACLFTHTDFCCVIILSFYFTFYLTKSLHTFAYLHLQYFFLNCTFLFDNFFGMWSFILLFYI